MKIVRLAAENVKRLTAIEIRPDGHVVTVGGKNGAGKSSVLDAIAYALGGQALIPEQPIRKGQDHAKVTVELDDLVVTRTFTAAGGGSLVVTNKDGARFPSPQGILDKLVGRLTFDPLSFARMEPAQQRNTLRRVVGLDFSEPDAQRQAIYTQRTDVSRQLKTLDVKLAELPRFADAPAEEISLADLSSEMTTAQAAYQAVAAIRAKSDIALEVLHEVALHEQRLDEEIAVLERQLAARRDARQTAGARTDEARARHAELQHWHKQAVAALPDLTDIQRRLTEAETVNKKVRANATHADLAHTIATTREQAAALTATIAALDTAKADAIAAAHFPIPNLQLSDVGVVFNDLPFEQASTAEQLRVSVAVGLALNPTLKVLLVRDGSMLDSDSLRLMAEMAAAADAQVWIERVAESKDGVSVLIEDGVIKR